MPKNEVYIGAKIGRLEVVARAPKNRHGQAMWLCRCTCPKGSLTKVAQYSLANGGTMSCGCLRDEATTARNTKHNYSRVGRVKPEYSVWLGMKDRCFNSDSPNFHDYGKRGIRVCSEWQDSFEAFLRDMGERPGPGYSIERRDVNGHYEPNNCYWATRMEQGANTRRNRMVTYQGERLHVSEAARRSGLSERTILSRLRLGWPEEKLFLKADRARHFRPKTGRPAKKMLPYEGKMTPLVEVARRTGISRYTLEDRVAAGWPLDRLYEAPNKSRRVVA